MPIERGLSLFSDLVSVWRLLKVLRRIQPDILHAHFSKPGIIGMIAGTLARTPIRIYHNHGMALTSARGWRWLVLWIVMCFSCSLAHRVAYVSASVLADAERLGVCRPGKGRVIRSANGLESTTDFAAPLRCRLSGHVAKVATDSQRGICGGVRRQNLQKSVLRI